MGNQSQESSHIQCVSESPPTRKRNGRGFRKREFHPDVAQFGSALDLGSSGRGFESRYPDFIVKNEMCTGYYYGKRKS